MAEWGINEKGFYCPTYEEILDDKIKYAKELFGEYISTSELTPLGKLLRINAKNEHKIYETAEQLYYSVSPATATGVSLERLGYFVGMRKNPAVCAVHLIRIYGTKDYTIKAGTLVRNTAGVTFYTVKDITLEETEENQSGVSTYYNDVNVQCTSAGTVGNTSGINNVVKVDSNISNVAYLKQVIAGKETESDVDFRKRYNQIVEGLGTNTASSIKANVLKISGVNECIIKDNTTNEDIVIDEDLTISKDTYGVIVHADKTLSEEIAKAIFEKQPFGIRQSGLEVVTVEDSAGEFHNVKFTFVKEKNIDIEIQCSVSGTFKNGGKEQIIENIQNYINNIAIGKSLVFSKLYECIYKVDGVEDVTNLTVNNTIHNIDVSVIEIVKCGTVNVNVTEV